MKILLADEINAENVKTSVNDDLIVTCQFCVKVSGQFFPDKSWREMAVSVLRWWIVEVLEHCTSTCSEFDLPFMEGPLYIKCRKNNDLIRIECIEDRDSLVIVCKEEIEMQSLLKELYVSATCLIRKIEQSNFGEVTELKWLKEWVIDLKEIVSNTA